MTTPKWATVERPRIVCLCGSTRFKQQFIEANMRLSLAGEIVLSVGLFNHADAVGMADAQKEAQDELHKRKIDLCDYVYVINVGGYVGSSTRGEIDYAERLGRPVVYLDGHGGAA